MAVKKMFGWRGERRLIIEWITVVLYRSIKETTSSTKFPNLLILFIFLEQTPTTMLPS